MSKTTKDAATTTKETADTAALVATWASEGRAAAEKQRKALADWWPLARAVAYGENPDPAEVRRAIADSGKTAGEFAADVDRLTARRPLVLEVQGLPRLHDEVRVAEGELGAILAEREERLNAVYAEFRDRILAVEGRRNDLKARILQATVFTSDALRNGHPNPDLHDRLARLRARHQSLLARIRDIGAARPAGAIPNPDRGREANELGGEAGRVNDEITRTMAEMVSY